MEGQFDLQVIDSVFFWWLSISVLGTRRKEMKTRALETDSDRMMPQVADSTP